MSAGSRPTGRHDDLCTLGVPVSLRQGSHDGLGTNYPFVIDLLAI